MKLGLLGGTFDPIHHGHLDVARAGQRFLDLDEVWVVPARQPPHRQRPHVSAAHRFAMAALAVSVEPGMRVSDVEMDRQGPSYSMDTLTTVRHMVERDSVICFLIGVDAFRDVPSWRGFPSVLDLCHFAVVSRPGASVTTLRTDLPQLAPRMIDTPCEIPRQPSILLVDAPTAAVSSTDVRRRLTEGDDVTGLVPDSVAAYIARHQLYRSEPIQNA